jgi:tRNA G18 (ribose-2'-O)-methylase SpoU
VEPNRITDPADPRVADYRRLNDTAFRRALESPGSFHHGLFVIEGWLALERALSARAGLRSVLVDDRRLDRLAELGVSNGVPVLTAAPDVLAEIVGFDLHRGVVAVAARPLAAAPDTVVRRSRSLLILEDVNDAENLGAIFRNSAGLGVDGVILDPRSADPLSRRAVRTSVGWVLSVPWARWELQAAVSAARDAGHRILALSPGGATSLTAVEPGPPTTLLLGAEGPGLSFAALDAADAVVRIPLRRDVDSLNVATAAAIAAWHCFGSTAEHS